MEKEKAEDIQKYIEQMKDVYDHLLTFIDNPDATAEEDYINLIRNIDLHDIQNQKELFNHFISLLVNISNEHHRQIGFFSKIERILKKYFNILKENNSNIEIYERFESNKRLLYFLIKEGIIIIDDTITKFITNKIEANGIRYSDYFLLEIPKSDNDNSTQDENITYYKSHLEEYEKKRQIGENDSYICSLIREDLIEEFVSYVNQKNISPSSKIERSIFETNRFLNCKEPTLIEYAAFFGSIQIFQYLYLNKAEKTGFLWVYGIHSNSPDLIQNCIENNEIKSRDQTYEEELKESIKCHHNDIGRYIEDNLIDENKIKENKKDEKTTFDERVYDIICKYHNYSFFPMEFNQKYAFYYSWKYNYQYIVNFLIEKRKEIIESDIIKTTNFIKFIHSN